MDRCASKKYKVKKYKEIRKGKNQPGFPIKMLRVKVGRSKRKPPPDQERKER